MDFPKIAMRKKRILYTDALTLLAATTVRIVSTTNGHILQRKQNKSNWNPLLVQMLPAYYIYNKDTNVYYNES